ncbi:LysR family transcriptional regulator [Ornithinimicrobium sp. Arc0846-15]|nr:LysR family transcriptional regulator [Ornithinimicrobium laminariae]
MIDPRLKSLQLVAWHGTVTAAAATLHYTPSTISAQLRSLAHDVGVPLMQRQGRTLVLTPAGSRLIDQAAELSYRWEQMHAELLAASPQAPQTLRLCGFSTAVASLLPGLAHRVMEAHPGSRVRIIEADPQECFELLLAGRANIAVVVTTAGLPRADDPRFEQRSLLSDPLDLLVPQAHPLADRTSVRLAETAQETWIMDHPGSTNHQLVLSACLAAGFTPNVGHAIVEWDAGAAMVHEGLGVALVPRLARLPAGYDIVRVPLAGDPSPSRHIRTGIRAGSSHSPLIATALSCLPFDGRENPWASQTVSP